MSTTIAARIPAPVLLDRILTRSLATDAVAVTAGAAFVALAAQVAVPLWPVPITMQTLAVLLVASAFGAVRGSLSMSLYLIAGLLGAPVFSDGGSGVAVVFGPSGGYIVGFVLAGCLTGRLSEREWHRPTLKAAVACGVGTIATFAVGLPWLMVALGATVNETLQWGLYPFIVGGIVKTAAAAILIPVAWRFAERLRGRD